MKFLYVFLFSLGCLAMTDSSIGVRRPVQLMTTTSPVTSAAWTQVSSATTYACSALVLSNSGGNVLRLGKGGSGSEVDTNLVVQTLAPQFLPIELAKSTRLSVKSLSGDQASGVISIICFQ